MTLSLTHGNKAELLQKARELMFKSICLGNKEATEQLHQLDSELCKRAKLKVVSGRSSLRVDTSIK